MSGHARNYNKHWRQLWQSERNIVRSYNTQTVQGCQMVCLQTKNPNLVKLWKVLQWKMIVCFIDTRSILQHFVIFYGHLV
jgi:hypothetical protein